jgi:UDP-N-acetylmuramate dehydrogenase
MPLIEVDGWYKIPAAWLIEHIAKAKGTRVGDVGTWPNQPLVIVNFGSATPAEVLDFSGEIVNTIKEKVGIELIREVNYIS